MKGCPACVVLKVLHSEPFIRIVVASCRLSKYLRDMLERNGGEQQQDENSCDTNKKAMTTGVEASTAATAALPDFSFWLNAVHRAVSEDDFWGLHFWEDIEARAEDLEMGVKELIRQCCGLSSFSTSAIAGTPQQQQQQQQQQQGSYYQTRRAVSSTLPGNKESAGMPHTITPSQTQSLKQQQLPASGLIKSNTCLTKRLPGEEQAWMRKVIEACWVMLTREAMMGGKRRMDPRGSAEAAVGMMRPAGAALRCRSLTT
ncbi:hypothetical protein EPUS_04322 [Endocarpon pusillum Z07020]|uniref:Uncharacterized protein n=1 Tax=Endocarpon pusillum (strain Z07020 / HMAS-L-300199) TaxID=1263415 RepID=U1HZB3_ENDPU|nr:uncharacterized protein EPUS_04322 [Endocarpon pusillum Z07020]ERF76245.1 hypothetical protein EPUS_04322 [Endocarpon pusillum Z07020]